MGIAESKAKYEAARLAWLEAVANVERLEAAMKAAEKELEIETIGQEAYRKLEAHRQWVASVCERYPS